MKKVLLMFFLLGFAAFGQWVKISTNLGASAGGALHMVREGTQFYFCSVQSGVWTSPDGVFWTNVSTGLPKQTIGGGTLYGAIRGVVKLGSKIYTATLGAGTIKGGVFVKEETDTVWTSISNGLSGFGLSPTGIARANDRILLFSGAGIHKLMTGDTTWTLSNTGVPAGAVPQAPSMIGSTIYTFINGPYRSTDKGVTWEKIYNTWPTLVPSGFFTEQNNYLFATNSDGVYRKALNDTAWQKKSNGLPAFGMNHIVNALGTLYVGTGSGVYKSTDDAENWTADNDGLGAIPFAIQGLYTDSRDIYAYMTITGVYKKSLLTDIGEDNTKPHNFELHGNYPNPFNPETNIVIELAKNAMVKVTIYNLLGVEVATIANEYFFAGKQSFRWNAIEANSGVYYYRVTVNGETLTKNMLLLK